MKMQGIQNDLPGSMLGFIYGLIGGTDLLNALLLGAAGFFGSRLAHWSIDQAKKFLKN